MNMATLTEPASSAAEMTSSTAGTVMLILRPQASATHEMPMDPKNAPAWKMPTMTWIRSVALARVASSKYSMKVGWARVPAMTLPL